MLGATMHSRIVSVEAVEPNLEDDQVFVDTLLKFAQRYPGKTLLLVPCGDNYIKLLVRNQDKLRGAYRFECIDEPLLMRLSIKESFYQVCEEHGFAFPKTTTCSFENHKGIELPFDFPVIIKPSNSVAYWNCRFPTRRKFSSPRTAKNLTPSLTPSTAPPTRIISFCRNSFPATTAACA